MTFKSAEPTVLREQKMRSPQAFARSVGCGTQPTGEVNSRRNLRAYIPENSVFGGARLIPTAFGFLFFVDDLTIIVARAHRSRNRTYNDVIFYASGLFIFTREERETRRDGNAFDGSFFLREKTRKTRLMNTAKQCTEVHCFTNITF